MKRCYYILLLFTAVTFVCCKVGFTHELGNTSQDYFTPESTKVLTIAYKPESNFSNLSEKALLKAANSGNCDDQFLIALMFGQGNGVRRNFSRCVSLLEKAANNGHIGAAFLLGTIYLKGGDFLGDAKGGVEYGGIVIPEDFPYDLNKAFSFYLISGNGGDKLSQNICHLIKEKLVSSKADTDKAVKMLHTLEQYSKDGNALAQRFLAELYCKGELVKQDYYRAFELYKESAERGDVQSQYNLARKYLNGLGVKQDSLKGFKWMKKAAEQNLAAAQFYLSILYYKGEGTIRNKKMGYVWLLIAMKNGHEGAKLLLDGAGSEGLTPEEDKSAHETADKILAKIKAENKSTGQMKVLSYLRTYGSGSLSGQTGLY